MLTRIISALIALPVLIAFVITGGQWFTAFVAVAGLIATWELLSMIGPTEASAADRGLAALALINVPLMLWGAMLGSALAMLAVSSLVLLGFGLLTVYLYPQHDEIFSSVPKYFLSVGYIAVPLGMIIIIRNMPDGIAWVFFLLVIVFANDVAAYFVGTRWGRRKLWPAVSPGKTIEGSAGGLAACLILGGVYWGIFLQQFPLGETLLCVMAIGIAGPLGDLFESVIKRTCGVKDSGRIMPGHGGLMDRVDAVMITGPYVYLVSIFIHPLVR